ncbi:MAG: DUF4910 domain-containing protein [Acidobacteriota bacterium]
MSVELGTALYGFAERAFPINRSITGEGVRETLRLLAEIVPALTVHEVPTGTPVLDWTVPKEWVVRGAWIDGPDGKRVVDLADHTLHLMGYSAPVRARMPLAALQEHLFSLPDQPDAIPYRTSYWKEHWAFCVSHRQRESWVDGEYDVVVDTDLVDGHLTYGEVVLPPVGEGAATGEAIEWVLVSAHICHPSLANDNLSGLAVAIHLARLLDELPRRRYGYRIVFVPGTIGAITWLACNRELVPRIRHGLVAANLGDGGAFHFKRSRRGDTVLDHAVETVLRDSDEPHDIVDFEPFGYDERQYGSPGFDLAVGLLSRTPWGRFPEYHTSGDDLDLIAPGPLVGSLRRYLEVMHLLEHDRAYRNLAPEGEPQLGRRGLYHHIGGGEEGRERQLAMLWVLNQSDGEHTLLDIARRSGLPFRRLLDAARALLDADLLAPVDHA